MFRKPVIRYGSLFGAAIGAYYCKEEITNVSIGVVRLARAGATVGGIILDYRQSLYSQQLDETSDGYKTILSEVHLRSAQRLLRLCEANGGAFIKVGQHLGALDYLIPNEYVRTMRVLHSHAPQSTFEEIMSVIRKDLQCEPSEVFEHIEEKSLGSASLAQVHKAHLKDGTTVAIKVQHPLVKTYAQIDIKSMELLIDAVMWVFPDFKLGWLVRETKINLPCELNFLKEGLNAEKAEKLLSHLSWLHIPKVYWNLSTSRVLTMEYCQGLEIGELAQNRETKMQSCRRNVSKKLTQLFSEMIFLHGFIHCDPHPGNLKIELDSNGEPIVHLLDHGLYSQLPSSFRENYADFWMAIISGDVVAIEEKARKLGVGELYGLFACMASGRSWDAIQAGIDVNQKTESEEKEIKNDAAKYVVEIMEVLHRVPRYMLLILKTNDLLRGLDSMLGIKENPTGFVTMARSCANATFVKEYAQCTSYSTKIKASLRNYIAHVRISVYEVMLWWSSWKNRHIS